MKWTLYLLILSLLDSNVVVERWFAPHCISFFFFVLRLVLPSSSQKWQKNQIDIKMYLSGVVQVCFAVLCLWFSHFIFGLICFCEVNIVMYSR